MNIILRLNPADTKNILLRDNVVRNKFGSLRKVNTQRVVSAIGYTVDVGLSKLFNAAVDTRMISYDG